MKAGCRGGLSTRRGPRRRPRLQTRVRPAPQRRYGLEWLRVDATGRVEVHDDEPRVDRWTSWKVNFLSVLVLESVL